MGTTLTAKNAGSLRSVYIALIEGYQYALTNGTVAAAQVALAGTDWDGLPVLGGLYVSIDNDQSIHPFQPIGDGGKCVLRVAPTNGDQFGIDTHKKRSAFETQLVSTLHRGSSTVKVAATTGAPTSGYIHIGTECIKYTGITAASGIDPASFTGCSRGWFMPLKTGKDPSTNFAQQHRVTLDPQSVLLQPIVSTSPRIWEGRWIAIYEHRIVDGVLDVIGQAHLAFAGKIVTIDDDGSHIAIECEHVLDVVKRSTVGRSLWSANVKEGIYLKAPTRFELREDVVISGSVGQNDADDLVTQSGASAGAYQIPQGYYTAEELHSRLEGWLAQALFDGDIIGSYSFFVDPNHPDGARTIIRWSAGGVDTITFRLVMESHVAAFMGFLEVESVATTLSGVAIMRTNPGGGAQDDTSPFAPLRSYVDKFGGGDNRGLNFEVEDQRGLFVDQFASLPSAFNLIVSDSLEWGLFLFDGNVTILGAVVRDGDGNVVELIRCMLSPVNLGPAYNDTIEHYAVPWDDSSPDIQVRQVLAITAPAADFIKLCFYSTGTVSHNHDFLDGLVLGQGLAIPGVLLGAEFEASCDALLGATEPVVSLIDKATTFEDLIEGDLILRRAFLHWHNGKLLFGTWRTPRADEAVATLTEANKATPAGHNDNHLTSSRSTSDWQKQIAHIYFDRDITNLEDNEGYRSMQPIEDATAVDDAGGIGDLVTIKVRNAFGASSGLGSSTDALIAHFASTFTMFSRPGKLMTRTITPSLVGQLKLGDTVNVSDKHARNPLTGIREIEELPAIVVAKTDDMGGANPDGSAVTDPTATVVVFVPFASGRDEANYSPAADVDDTHDAGDYDAGYNSVTKTLRCYGYRYGDDGSLIAPLLTDAEYFPAGAEVLVTERDPEDPSAPQYWTDVVASQSVDDITLTTGLSGWDNTKTYRVTPVTYSDATTAQRLKAFQADYADALIEDVGAPYPYSGATAASQFAEDMNSTIGIELPADHHGTDGAARDVGTEQLIARVLDNFIDYKSAVSLPSLANTPVVNDTHPPGYKLLMMSPIHLTGEVLSSAVWRDLNVAPLYRSATGAVVILRASLCRTRPSGTSLNDVNRGSVYAEVTWTTSNTNWETGAINTLDCRRKESFTGQAWLIIEGSWQCETRGFAHCQESERKYDNEWWVP